MSRMTTCRSMWAIQGRSSLWTRTVPSRCERLGCGCPGAGRNLSHVESRELMFHHLVHSCSTFPSVCQLLHDHRHEHHHEHHRRSPTRAPTTSLAMGRRTSCGARTSTCLSPRLSLSSTMALSSPIWPPVRTSLSVFLSWLRLARLVGGTYQVFSPPSTQRCLLTYQARRRSWTRLLSSSPSARTGAPSLPCHRFIQTANTESLSASFLCSTDCS